LIQVQRARSHISYTKHRNRGWGREKKRKRGIMGWTERVREIRRTNGENEEDVTKAQIPE
jgi:hypothetical protein